MVAMVACSMGPPLLRLVRDRITRADFAVLATAGFGDMVKAVVDVERRVMAIGGELHFDSMINVRPARGNPSRSVTDPSEQARIRAAVAARR